MNLRQFLSNLDNELNNKLDPAKQAIQQGIQRVKQTPVSRFTPFSMREQTVPAFRVVGQAIKKPQLAEDIGYAVRGAQTLTPFQSNPFNRSEREKMSDPTTERQNTAERIGRAAYGTALTAPIGGSNVVANIASRIIQGGTLGVGLGAAGNVIQGKKITDNIKENALKGVENSWQLAITNAVNNAILGKVAPALTDKAISGGKEAVASAARNPEAFKDIVAFGLKGKPAVLASSVVQTISRAIAETPIEDAFFTLTDKLSGKEKDKFVNAFQKNFAGYLTGNLIFGALSAGKTATVDYNAKIIDGVKLSMKNAWKQVQENQPIGLTTKAIGGSRPPLKDIQDAIKEGKITDEEGLLINGSRPWNQAALEDAANSRDWQSVIDILDQMPKDDPYKGTMEKLFRQKATTALEFQDNPKLGVLTEIAANSGSYEDFVKKLQSQGDFENEIKDPRKFTGYDSVKEIYDTVRGNIQNPLSGTDQNASVAKSTLYDQSKNKDFVPYSNELSGLQDAKKIFDAGEMEPDEAKKFVGQWNDAVTSGAIDGKPIKETPLSPLEARLKQADQVAQGADQPAFGLSTKPTKASKARDDIMAVIAGNDAKEKSLITRIKGDEKYPQELRDLLTGDYVPQSNKETIDAAKKLVYYDPQAAEIRAMNPRTAVDQATGAELFNYYMEKGNVSKANEILNATSGTNEGQMVQILSQYDKGTPTGAIRFAKNIINNYNVTHSRSKIDLSESEVQDYYNQATKIQAMPEGREKNMAIADLTEEINNKVPSSIVDKFITVWKAGLLTSLRTHERNILGNSTMGAAEVVKDVPASFIDRMLSYRTGQRTLTPTIQGSGEGAAKGIQSAKDIINFGYDPEGDIEKYDVRHITWGDNPTEQALKKYTDIVFRTLGAADKPFWNSQFARSLYSQAGAEAMNQGKAGDADFIKSLVSEPTDEMLANATKDANYATFHDKNTISAVANAVKQTLSKHESTKLISEVLAPFTGVPSSIATKLFDYSPAGLAKGIFESGKVALKDIPDLQRQAAQDLGRGVVGTALFALGSYLVSKGLMTGNPKDPAEARQWELEGKQRNSVLIGGKWRSINSLAPQQLIMLAGAKWQQEFGQGGDKSYGKFAGQVGKDFMQQTFLKGVQDPLNALSDPTRYGSNYFQSQAGSLVPNIVKDTARSIDATGRETNNVGDAFKESTPLLRNTLLPRRDALGNPIPQEPTGFAAFIDLFNSKTPRGSLVIDELSRLNDAGFNATPSEIKADQKVGGVDMKLTPEQLDQFEKQVGEMAQAQLPNLIQSPKYQRLGDEQKANAIDKLMTAIRSNVRKTIEFNANNVNEGFTQSSDAPKGLLEKAGTYGKATITDPLATINAVLDGNPIRKVSGDAVILERKNSLGSLDKGDKSTVVDHIIPLSLGGTNDESNLVVQTKEESMAKDRVETYLGKLLKSGDITKKEAQDRIKDWRNELGSLPEKDQMKLAQDITSMTESGGNVYSLVNPETGTSRTIDLSTPIESPEKTGVSTIDKKLASNYKSKVTKRINDIIALYEDGQLSLEEAKSLLGQLQVKSTSGGAGTKKAKKAKKGAMGSIRIAKGSTPSFLKISKAPNSTITTRTGKSLAQKLYQIGDIKIAQPTYKKGSFTIRA